MLPLTDLTPSRSHVTLVSTTSPLTVRDWVVAPVAIEAVPLVCGAQVHVSGPFVDDASDRRQLASAAPRALDRLDRDLVARSAGDRDLTGDVLDRHAAIAADLHLARDALGLLRSAIATLIRTTLDARTGRDDVPDDVADDDPDRRIGSVSRRRRSGGKPEHRDGDPR